jgi:dienelactone hydrolase
MIRSRATRLSHVLPVAAVLLIIGSAAAQAGGNERLDFPLRGKTLTVAVYRPSRTTPLGTILMGSGDVGWVGLAVDMSEFLAAKGYTVVGINVRQYLGAFTSGKVTLKTDEPPADYLALFHFLEARKLITRPVFVAGVSEGAALAVLAGASAQNRAWVNGVLTMGLPPSAELGWRWTDFTSWITKKDSNEPMFSPKEFVPAIAPLPLFMIQSTTDEYVSESDYRTFERVAREPKKLVLIKASNHRFTDRREELQSEVMNGIAWMREHQPPM